ncbi:MAG TPA: transcription termination factor Rho [Planctomycetes bacterium]|nr:transcription termination factor Rho [Planctomycetota bacterium]
MAKKRTWQRKKKFKPSGSGGGTALAIAPSHEIKIDTAALPADLNEEELDDLEASLPPSTRKTKPKATSYDELAALPLAELLELAKKEKVEVNSRRRRDLIWEIASARLRKHIPMRATGLLEVTTAGHGFLRYERNSYLPDETDPVVPPSWIQRYTMRTGMTIEGMIRAPLEGEKYFALKTIDQIDWAKPELVLERTAFKDLVPLYPDERILLEGTNDNPLEMRIADLVTPIGRGQRGLIVAPPRSGKTVLLHQIARSIVENAPDVHLMIVLIDERPEEVTDFQRSLPEGSCEVIASTFDESTARHIKVAQMVIEKARCMVEAGRDVAILLDSITRLARSANNEAPSNGKLLSGGLEATALQFPKRFFGSARNIEDGGSLTILGTALVETGSKMDEVIFEEFKGTGNMELVLDRRLSDRRIYPAIDINRSGTRKEELLFTEEEIARVWMLLKVLNELDPVEAMEMLIQKMRRTGSNGEFLLTIGS